MDFVSELHLSIVMMVNKMRYCFTLPLSSDQKKKLNGKTILAYYDKILSSGSGSETCTLRNSADNYSKQLQQHTRTTEL